MPSKSAPLTKSRIERARVPEGKSEIWLRDSIMSGYAARKLPSGRVTLVYRYRPEGGGRRVNPRTVKLGTYPSISVEDGRAAARILAGNVARGKDPARERAEERRRQRAMLGQLLAEGGPYELHLKERGLVNIKVALSALRRGLKAHMTADVAALSRNDVVTAIDALTRIGKRGAASDLRKFARSFCEWTVQQGLTRANVMAGLRAPGRTRQQRLQAAERRGRALSDAELVKVWQAAEAMQAAAARGERVSGSFGGLVKLALLSAMRRGELSQLEHGHILGGGTEGHGIAGERIALPRTITKTASDHAIPVSPLMRTVIAAQPRTTSALLFPSRLTGARITGWTKLVKQLQALSGVEVEMHDLRRSCRTLMSRLGVAEDIAELAIGHQRADLVARYNKDEAWPGRVAAFEAVSAHIAGLLANGNVVPIRKAG